MSAATVSTADVVRALIAEQLCLEPGDPLLADGTTSLRDTLDLDSLDAVELSLAIEDEFAIRIPDDDFAQWCTVQDIVDYVERRIAG